MQMNRKQAAVGILATLFVVTLSSMLGGNAWFARANPFINTIQVKFRDPAAGNLISDTTYVTDENDTVRTVPVITSDWDWQAIGMAASTGAAAANGARIFFVSSNATNNGATDSLYFTIEKGVPQDTSFTYNGTMTAALGAVALPEGTAGPLVNVWVGSLLCDPDTPAANNVWMAPAFRVKLCGDQSGTTPKISAVKCYISYPKRAESQ